MKVSVRFSSVSPTSLASSMSFSSVRRVRSSLRASAATSPLATSARRSRRPASRSRDCKRSTKTRQASDGDANFVDQPLLFKWIEIDVANGDGNLHTRPRHVPLRADIRPFLRLQCFIELRGLLQRGLVQFRNLVDVLERLLCFVGDLFF